ncbi:MAG: peptidase M48 [Ignavibacteriales bacterium CG18_big_fil_WC_8_21_14_2_50_31_20]|nr:MAG: peptidase M48 [Ignavibacteriales bacterium CG18_big_fil_WC_8_21_14_2_50_31_20]
MKTYVKTICIIFLSIFSISCSIVPITGRSQLSIIPASEIMSASYQQYDQFLKENKLSNDKQNSFMIKNVGSRIQKAVEQYFAQQKLSNQLDGYQWEFNLIENNEINAWCMPGGKVVFYSGILPVCENDLGVAVVMGHEIAHAIAEHGAERMSQGLVAQLGGMGLSIALKDKPQETQQLWMTAFGVGTQLGVMLPFSRLHENEADHLGLIFMAIAGYNPQGAIDFWKRMATKKSGSAPPEFLSTHPSDETRIENLRELLPDALKYYKK